MQNSKSNQSAGSQDDAAFQLLSDVAMSVRFMFEKIKPERALPFLTALKEYKPIFVMALPKATAEIVEPGTIDHIKTTLRAHSCDGAVVAYPVQFQPRQSSQADSGIVHFGMMIEIQLSQRPNLIRVMPLVGQTEGRNIFGPLLPIKGLNYALSYSNLIDNKPAA